MNTCFTYNWLSSLDTNRSAAAFRWASLGRQTGKKDKNGNPINPEIIYLYYDGTRVIDGGKYDLIWRINNELNKRTKVKEQLFMIYDHPTQREDTLLENKQVNGSTKSGGENLLNHADYKASQLATTNAIQSSETNEVLDLQSLKDEVIDVVTQVPQQKKSPVSKTSKTPTKVRVSFSKPKDSEEFTQRPSDFIEKYIDLGYRLNEEDIPLTMELYHRALMHLQTKEFKENFDKNNPDTGSSYKIGSYVCSLLFAPKKYVAQMSWIAGQIGTLIGKYEILQDREMVAKTGLTAYDEDGKETPLAEAEEALSKRKLNPQELIEIEDTFKEVFCVLALVNVIYKNDLWELITINYVKMSNTLTNDAYGQDHLLHETLRGMNTKINRKDASNARDNGSLNQQVYHTKSWVYLAIKQAIKYLGLPHIVFDVQHINSKFLERTDLIRACKSAQEFLEVVKYDSTKIKVKNLGLSREAVICQRLNLSKTYNYLNYKDIVGLALAPVSQLPFLLERAQEKIKSAMENEVKREDKIAKYEVAIQKLQRQIDEGMIYGDEIDLTQKPYSISDLNFKAYTGHFKRFDVKNAQTELLNVNLDANWNLVFTDRNGNPTDKYKGYKLADFHTFDVAVIRPIGTEMTKEVKKKFQNQIQVYKDAILAEKHEISKLNGTDPVFDVRNVARPSDMVECEALILNTWVEPLIEQFENRNFNIRQNWERWKSLSPNAPKEQKEIKTQAENAFKAYQALLEYNLAINLKCCETECLSTFGNDYNGYVDASVNCKQWYLWNTAYNRYCSQDVKFFEVTSDGTKQSQGGTPTRAFLRREGVYVLTTEVVCMIIPAWYGCLTQNAFQSNLYFKDLDYYSDTLTTVIAAFSNFYSANKYNAEKIEKFSEQTGVYFLSREDAYDHVINLKENCSSQLLYTHQDQNGKDKLFYHGVFVNLAKIAGVTLDDPNKTLKEQREGSATI